MDPGLHRLSPHAYGCKERAGLRGATSLGPEDTKERTGEGLNTHGYTTARIKDLKVIGHANVTAVAAEMVYTLTGLVGWIPKPHSRAKTQYPNVLEPVPHAKSFTKKPVQALQQYDASTENTLNEALSEHRGSARAIGGGAVADQNSDL